MVEKHLPDTIMTSKIVQLKIAKALSGYRRLKGTFVSGPLTSIRQQYRSCAAYTQASAVLRSLRTSSSTAEHFRSSFGGEIDHGHLQLYLGAAFANYRDDWFSRGKLKREAIPQATGLVNNVLAVKQAVALEPRNVQSALRVESSTDMTVRYFKRSRNLFWSLLQFPWRGLYILLIRPIFSPTARQSLRQIRAEMEKDRLAAIVDQSAVAAATTARKYQYSVAMTNAVVDLMKAAASGLSVEELCFKATELIVNAIPFMTRSQLYRVKETDGKKQAVAVAWAGKRGYHDAIVKLQAELMRKSMVYDLVRKGEGEGEAVPVPTLDPVAINQVLLMEGVTEASAVDELRFSVPDAERILAGRHSLVALSILDDVPIICTDTVLDEETHSARAINLITGETVYPDYAGMKILNVREFFVAPFEGGALLGSVDLPKDMPQAEILNIMESYCTYARILGMIINNRAAAEKFAAFSARIARLADTLKQFVPEQALEYLENETRVMLQERHYVTIFADVTGSTGIDRLHRDHPSLPHAERNAVFNLVLQCLSRGSVVYSQYSRVIKRHSALFESSPLKGELCFRLRDERGASINRAYIELINDSELTALWEASQVVKGEAFGFKGDAIVGAIPAFSGTEVGTIEAKHVARALQTMVRAVRKLAQHNQTDKPVSYKLKVGIGGGLVSVGFLGSQEERRGEITTIGYPVDETARLADGLSVYGGMRETTPPLAISAKMIDILLAQEMGQDFLRRYVMAFNEYILRDLLGSDRYTAIWQELRQSFRGSSIPAAEVIAELLRQTGQQERLKGFVPLQIADVLKGPYDIEKALGRMPRGMDGEKFHFYLLEWDTHYFNPNKNPDFARAARQADPDTELPRLVTQFMEEQARRRRRMLAMLDE